jgi:high-affinity Fe2+/Pb2+ permease
MSSSTATRSNDVDYTDQPRRLSTETKNSTKTTEFFAFVAMVVAVVVTANLYDGSGTEAGGDPFGATTAMRYVVYLTVAYMIARGLAKSGSREVYDA